MLLTKKTDSSLLAIVAGRGDLPLRLAEQCQKDGRPCVVFGFFPFVSSSLFPHLPFEPLKPGAIFSFFRLLRKHRVSHIVFAGGIPRPAARQLPLSLRTLTFISSFFFKKSRSPVLKQGDDALFTWLVSFVTRCGYQVLDPVDFLPDMMVSQSGPLGGHRPKRHSQEDIRRGVEVLEVLAPMDVGQALIIQQGLVLGIEAIEGTDALIQRCASLQRPGPGGVLVKLMKKGQEGRVDRPSIGPRTLHEAAQAGLSGIALERDGTQILSLKETIRLADENNLFITAIDV